MFLNRKPRRVVLVVLLLISIVNYTRIVKDKSVRTVEVLSVFVIGMLSSLLITELLKGVTKKEDQENDGKI